MESVPVTLLTTICHQIKAGGDPVGSSGDILINKVRVPARSAPTVGPVGSRGDRDYIITATRIRILLDATGMSTSDFLMRLSYRTELTLHLVTESNDQLETLINQNHIFLFINRAHGP